MGLLALAFKFVPVIVFASLEAGLDHAPGVRSMTITFGTANARRTDPKGYAFFLEESDCAKKTFHLCFVHNNRNLALFPIIPGCAVDDPFDMSNRRGDCGSQLSERVTFMWSRPGVGDASWSARRRRRARLGTPDHRKTPAARISGGVIECAGGV